MNVGPDDKAYKGAGVPFDDVVRQMYPIISVVPMSKGLNIDDICYYVR